MTHRAHALNDDDPPRVVGTATFRDESECGSVPAPAFLRRAFTAELGSTPSELPINLNLGGNFQWSRALSINNAATPLTAGDIFEGCQPDEPHDVNVFPVEWNGGPVGLTRVEPDMGGQALKINDAGNSVGWAREQDDGPIGSLVIATYWDTSTSGPEELGNYDALDPFEQTIAYGVNETAPLTVVGHSITADAAIAWFQDSSGQWVPGDTSLVVELNTVLVSGCDSEWVLIEAFDVNDDGRIVGHGERNGVPHAFLLVDENEFSSCAADLSQCPDAVVDVFDLLVLLSNWGTDGPGAGLDEPLDTVDVFDLLVLLGAWGGCPSSGLSSGDIPETVEDCLDKFDPGTIELEKCLEAVQGEL